MYLEVTNTQEIKFDMKVAVKPVKNYDTYKSLHSYRSSQRNKVLSEFFNYMVFGHELPM